MCLWNVYSSGTRVAIVRCPIDAFAAHSCLFCINFVLNTYEIVNTITLIGSSLSNEHTGSVCAPSEPCAEREIETIALIVNVALDFLCLCLCVIFFFHFLVGCRRRSFSKLFFSPISVRFPWIFCRCVGAFFHHYYHSNDIAYRAVLISDR